MAANHTNTNKENMPGDKPLHGRKFKANAAIKNRMATPGSGDLECLWFTLTRTNELQSAAGGKSGDLLLTATTSHRQKRATARGVSMSGSTWTPAECWLRRQDREVGDD